MKRCVVFALGMALAAVSARAADETFDIRIQRPFKAGQSYALSATHTARSAETLDLPNGLPSRKSAFRRVVLEADVHVDKVDDAGAESAATLVIRKLTLQSTDGGPVENGAANEVLNPNTEIVMMAQAGGQPFFATKKAGTLSDDAMLALQDGFRRLSIADTVYGTAEKKKVGDTWTINTQALGGDKTSPNYVDPALISGSVTLKRQFVLAGVPCLQLDTTMAIKNFPVDGTPAKESTMSTLITVNEPVDTAKPILAWNLRSTTHIVKEESPMGRSVIRRTEDSELVHEATVTPK